MAIFILKTAKTFVIRSAGQQVIVGARGPEVVQIPGVTFKLEAGRNVVTDEAQIARIRSDEQFNTSEITEFSEEDQEAVAIREEAYQEAEKKIKAKKAAKK